MSVVHVFLRVRKTVLPNANAL